MMRSWLSREANETDCFDHSSARRRESLLETFPSLLDEFPPAQIKQTGFQLSVRRLLDSNSPIRSVLEANIELYVGFSMPCHVSQQCLSEASSQQGIPTDGNPRFSQEHLGI